MDTETVLKIVKTIENRLTFKDLNIGYAADGSYDDSPEYNFQLGMISAFNELKNYLDFFIDKEVSQVENEMNRGE
jgi:hypothetical protein